MVRLTTEYIARCNGHTKRKRDEPTDHYLKRITHLYMAERNIETIDNLSQCRNLTVLYLYDNKLNKTMNLGTAQNLTHLYLQNNNIRKIEGLKHLQRLTKLYLGYNNLTVVEGLQSLELLKELNVEYQRLPPGEKLLFEPRTLMGLKDCLKTLNVSGNHLDSLQELTVLAELTNLQASDNEIGEFSSIQGSLAAWRRLEKLDLTGNPICHKAKYRDKVIVMSQSMELLDNREISRLERQFLVSWNASREARRRHRLESSQKNEETMDLPPLYNPPAPTPPPHYMMGGLPGGRKRFEAILAKSRSLPNSAAVRQMMKKPKAPYTTPRMNSTIMEHDVRPENELLGQKSISDLTDRRKLERQMTPHPNRNRRGKPGPLSAQIINQSPNGFRPDMLGGGDPFGGGAVIGLQDNGEIPQRIQQYPSLRGSRVNVRPSLSGISAPELILSEKTLIGDSISPIKALSPSASRDNVNGSKYAILPVSNGVETQNGISNHDKP